MSLVLDRSTDKVLATTLADDLGKYKFATSRKAVKGKKFFTEAPEAYAPNAPHITCMAATSKVVKP